MSDKKKEIFKVEKKDGDGKVTKVTEYAVLTPRPQDGREAQKVYNETFAAALKSGGLLRERVSTYMREQGLWSDEKEAKQKALIEELNRLELKLQRGGIKLTEAREIALDMRRTRIKLRDLISKRNELDVNTVEGQAENARFNALVARCLVYNETGEPVYKDVDDYLTNGADEAAFRGAQALASIMFQLDKDHESSLPENQFLSRFKFIDEELRLINSDGKLCDADGKLINEEGHYVDAEGNLVDIDGNLVNEEGNYVVDQQPFLDDDGNPIVEDESTPVEAPAEDEEEPAAEAAG
jgi:hypothetical protein